MIGHVRQPSNDILQYFGMVGLGKDISLEWLIVDALNKLAFEMNVLEILVTLWACNFTVRGWWFKKDKEVFYGFIIWLGNGAKFEAVDSWIWLLCNNIFYHGN